MRRGAVAWWSTVALVAGSVLASPGRGLGGGLFDHLFTNCENEPQPMSQIGRMIDRLEEEIRDDGFVVIKRPDRCQWTRIVTRLVNPNCYEA
jgi:hypothetical protein